MTEELLRPFCFLSIIHLTINGRCSLYAPDYNVNSDKRNHVSIKKQILCDFEKFLLCVSCGRNMVSLSLTLLIRNPRDRFAKKSLPKVKS